MMSYFFKPGEILRRDRVSFIMIIKQVERVNCNVQTYDVVWMIHPVRQGDFIEGAYLNKHDWVKVYGKR